MSHKIFNQLKQELKIENTEVITYDYARIFFQNSSLPQELLNKIAGLKDDIKNETGVEINGSLVGKNKSIVMIEGLGSLLERSPESFENIRNLLRRYVSGERIEGTAKKILRSAEKKKEEPKREKESVVVKRRETPKPKEKQMGDKGDIEGILYDGEIEKSFTEYIIEEDTEVCPTMVKHAVENYGLSEAEAKKQLVAWAEKNEETLEYQPDYMEGVGIINRKI